MHLGVLRQCRRIAYARPSGARIDRMDDRQCAEYFKKILKKAPSWKTDYVRATGLFKHVVKVRHEMKAAGCEVGMRTYGVLLQWCVKTRQVEYADVLVKEIEERGLAWSDDAVSIVMSLDSDPTVRSAYFKDKGVPLPGKAVSALFAHYRRTGDEAAAAELFRSVAPNNGTRLGMIQCCKTVGTAVKYYKLLPLHEQSRQGIGALLHVCLRTNDSATAEKLLIHAQNKKTDKTGFYNTVALIYLNTGQHEKVETLIKEMTQRGKEADEYTYATYLSSLAALLAKGDKSALHKAEALFGQALLEEKLKWCQRIYGGLLEVYSKIGAIGKATRLRDLQQMNKVAESRQFTELFEKCQIASGQMPLPQEIHESVTLYTGEERDLSRRPVKRDQPTKTKASDTCWYATNV